MRFALLTALLACLVSPAAARGREQEGWQEIAAAAKTAFDRGNYTDAEKLFTAALAEVERNGLGGESLAMCLNNLGVFDSAIGRFGVAADLIRRSLELRTKAFGSDHPLVATCLHNLAEIHRAGSELELAEPLYRRALDIWQRAYGPNDSNVGTVSVNLGELYRAQRRYKEAERFYRRAIQIFEQDGGRTDPRLAVALNDYGALYSDQRKADKARPIYLRVVALMEQIGLPDHPTAATALQNLAFDYREQRNLAAAEPLLRRAVEIWEKVRGNSADLARNLSRLADMCRLLGHYGEAEQYYRRALAIQEKTLGAADPGVTASLESLLALLNQSGRFREAEKIEARIQAIRSGYAR